MFVTFYWIVRLITMLSMNFWIALSSVWSRLFWASKILWWILTSIECTICWNSMQLMNSQLNIIHVWNVCNVLLKGQTYYIAFIEPLDRFIKCLKKMILSIQDSVMNSHIYWMHELLQLHAPNEFPIEYNSCLKCLMNSRTSFGWMHEVDVFEHPRFCDEFSHLLHCSSIMNSKLSTIHVWNVFNVLLKGQTYYNAFNELLDRFIKCLK